MQKIHFLKSVLVVAMLSIATPAFSEEAPVYDADSYSASDSEPSASPEAETTPAPAAVSSVPHSMQERVTRVEQQVSNLVQSGASSKMEALQSEVQSLRGQVEELTHQLQQMKTQQQAMYSDLDKRITTALQSSSAKPKLAEDTSVKPQIKDAIDENKAKKTASVGVIGAVDASSEPNVAEEQQIYQTAYDLIKTKKYGEAISALRGMLTKYPSGQFAANAHYWLGELYGLLGKNEQSAAEFSSVVQTFPNSPKVSDAQLKLGLIFAAESNWAEAKSAFKKVINRYPGTASARLASEQLKQIKMAGH